MRLFRFGQPGKEKPGILSPAGKYLDASGFGMDWNEAFFATDSFTRLQTWFEENSNLPEINPSERIASCVARPSKIVCIGLNFSDHAKEAGMAVPDEPVIFFKATSALCGPFDDCILPQDSRKVDWEVELAVVIGKRASYVAESNALQHVAGYALHNDYSERYFQLERSGQWVKGKSADSFAPLGPWLVTPDEIADIQHLGMWLDVNGERMQNGSTETMIFRIPEIVSYVSRFMTLLPGDVISTGTPPGVGHGMSPPRFLAAGDVVELGIDCLGTARQQVVAWNSLHKQ